ncbi:hypothetical protein, partial [Trichormus variabilis]
SDRALTSRLVRQTTLYWGPFLLRWSLQEISNVFISSGLPVDENCITSYKQKVNQIVNLVYKFLPSLIILCANR